jgi:hypothetical protein
LICPSSSVQYRENLQVSESGAVAKETQEPYLERYTLRFLFQVNDVEYLYDPTVVDHVDAVFAMFVLFSDPKTINKEKALGMFLITLPQSDQMIQGVPSPF